MIGSKNGKKHRSKDQESCVSIKMYQTGSVSGITDPIIFFLEGKNCHGTYSASFLLTNGDTIVSTIIRTPTSFMAVEEHANATPKIIEGLSDNYPIVKAKPQWWMTEVFGGFGPHTSSFK